MYSVNPQTLLQSLMSWAIYGSQRSDNSANLNHNGTYENSKSVVVNKKLIIHPQLFSLSARL